METEEGKLERNKGEDVGAPSTAQGQGSSGQLAVHDSPLHASSRRSGRIDEGKLGEGKVVTPSFWKEAEPCSLNSNSC